ncbi:MAG: molybdopterin converting factor subunit 1 [Magnetococcales bacterium]|nr:molybdopterin converting factor subunit 1 [Magnetococcales bacterium]
MARFLFFSRVREKIGQAGMEIILPTEVNDVTSMLAFLQQRGDAFATALTGTHLRVAVNQVYARPEDPVTNSDEIAIFPPVSGG